MLLNYEGVSLYAKPYNTGLQNCHENIPAHRKIYLSAFPMVIMKKLMMFYSLTQTKTIHPQASRYLEGWYNLYISYDNEKHDCLTTELQIFIFFPLISIAFSYPKMILIIEDPGSGCTEQQHIGKQMDIDFHLPHQNRGVNGTLTNSLFRFPESSSSLALHLASALSWGLFWRKRAIFPSINNN